MGVRVLLVIYRVELCALLFLCELNVIVRFVCELVCAVVWCVVCVVLCILCGVCACGFNLMCLCGVLVMDCVMVHGLCVLCVCAGASFYVLVCGVGGFGLMLSRLLLHVIVDVCLCDVFV